MRVRGNVRGAMELMLRPLLLPLPLSLLPLAGCATPGAAPGIAVRTVEVVAEVQRPCPATPPTRPAPLERPLPADGVALAALLGAKLVEWSGPGGYGERAEAALALCTGAR